MKRIYRLLVLLMGLVIFVGIYMVVKSDQYSALSQSGREVKGD